MAILRGGVKIFGQDIRIGLPRDKSLDNINKDPRFTEGGQVGQSESTINRFIAEINQGEGMARRRQRSGPCLPSPVSGLWLC